MSESRPPLLTINRVKLSVTVTSLPLLVLLVSTIMSYFSKYKTKKLPVTPILLPLEHDQYEAVSAASNEFR